MNKSSERERDVIALLNEICTPAAQIAFIYFDAPGKRRKRKPGKRNQKAEKPKDSCRRVPVHARRAADTFPVMSRELS